MTERTEPWRGFRIRSARRQPHERGADAQLNEIVDVISVGTTVDVAGARITLLSVERYDDGFVATFWFRLASSENVAFPDYLPQASDDRGGRYVAWPHGGSGGGNPGRVSWRSATRFAPRLDPAAHELRIEIPEVGLTKADESGRIASETVVEGPWSFRVPVPTRPA